MPGRAGSDAVIDVADPSEFLCLELGLLDEKQGAKGRRACENAEMDRAGFPRGGNEGKSSPRKLGKAASGETEIERERKYGKSIPAKNCHD